MYQVFDPQTRPHARKQPEDIKKKTPHALMMDRAIVQTEGAIVATVEANGIIVAGAGIV